MLLRHKTKTQGALGQTITIAPVGYKYAFVKPLDAKAQAAYQQLGSVVTHEVILSGEVTITLGDYDFIWGSKTLTPVTPPKVINGDTVIAVVEE